MTRNTQSYVLYESAYKQIKLVAERVSIEEAFKLQMAVNEFGLYGILPPEDSSVWLYGFEQIITSIGFAQERRTAAIENGKKGGRPQKIDRDAVFALLDEGVNCVDIATQCGCTTRTIEKIKKEEYPSHIIEAAQQQDKTEFKYGF